MFHFAYFVNTVTMWVTDKRIDKRYMAQRDIDSKRSPRERKFDRDLDTFLEWSTEPVGSQHNERKYSYDTDEWTYGFL